MTAAYVCFRKHLVERRDQFGEDRVDPVVALRHEHAESVQARSRRVGLVRVHPVDHRLEQLFPDLQAFPLDDLRDDGGLLSGKLR